MAKPPKPQPAEPHDNEGRWDHPSNVVAVLALVASVAASIFSFMAQRDAAAISLNQSNLDRKLTERLGSLAQRLDESQARTDVFSQSLPFFEKLDVAGDDFRRYCDILNKLGEIEDDEFGSQRVHELLAVFVRGERSSDDQGRVLCAERAQAAAREPDIKEEPTNPTSASTTGVVLASYQPQNCASIARDQALPALESVTGSKLELWRSPNQRIAVVYRKGAASGNTEDAAAFLERAIQLGADAAARIEVGQGEGFDSSNTTFLTGAYPSTVSEAAGWTPNPC